MEEQISQPSRKKSARHALIVIGLLFILPPFFFWLTVAMKFGGGTDVLFRFWSYLPSYMLDTIIMLLPIPSLLLGVLAFWQIKKRRGRGMPLAASLVILSILFMVLCTLAAFRPD